MAIAHPRKKSRLRYDRIMDSKPFSDGFEIMRDAQTAKPQAFKTGDGWFAYSKGTMFYIFHTST